MGGSDPAFPFDVAAFADNFPTERLPRAGFRVGAAAFGLVIFNAVMVAAVVAVLLTGVVDSNHSYFKLPWQSLTDILRNTALLGIFALGATVVIIAGGIDLSAGTAIALCATVLAWSLKEDLGPRWFAGETTAAVTKSPVLLVQLLRV